ncbi:DUF2806 domain-containing protein [Polyangium sp. 15x6]|uniref:DUF2806 domain-containing protein n=1 Tax=Polyangium sp. 15x6 TaxID=3042687 RepID=UPI00249AB530|nr:DUF2806 domain-containing protein [Polyangium sp. 15x6]MDI3282085.1 DUF2806 domain-containing protein [Polyangium sp. 15x6]
MGDPSPFSVNIPIKGFSKLFDILKSYFGTKLIRPTAEAEAHAKLLTAQTDAQVKPLLAQTDAQVRLIAVQAELAERKARLQGEHELRALEEELRAKALPAPVEDIIDVMWEPAAAEIVVDTPQQKPFEHVEQKRFRNIKQVTAHAMRALPEHQEVSDEPVDPDWTARFFDNVKDVSNEDMQKLWAQLLAGEIAQPGRFSLRTLETLRNLTSAEAQLFHRYLTFCDDSGQIFLPGDDVLPARCGMHHSEMLQLVDCGLLLPEKDFMFGNTEGAELRIRYRGKILRIYGSGSQKRILPKFWGGVAFTLTGAGRELGNLQVPPVDERYLRALIDSAAAVELKGEYVDAPATPPATGSPTST